MICVNSFSDNDLINKGVNAKTYADRFITLSRFGFDVKSLDISVINDGFKNHFALSCSHFNSSNVKETLVNAFTFFEKLSASSEGSCYSSFYCDFCVIRSVDSQVTGFASDWYVNVNVLTNVLLFDETPITSLQMFHAVTSAFELFVDAVEDLKYFFESTVNPLHELVVKVQSERLKAAKEFLLKDPDFLFSEFKRMLPVEETMIGFMNGSNDLSAGVTSSRKFSNGSSPRKSRRSVTLRKENKFLNLIEILFTQDNERVLVGPSTILNLWAYVSQEYFESNVLVLPVNVLGSSHGEFVETFNVLIKQVSFTSSSDVELFDEVTSVLDTAVTLTKS